MGILRSPDEKQRIIDTSKKMVEFIQTNINFDKNYSFNLDKNHFFYLDLMYILTDDEMKQFGDSIVSVCKFNDSSIIGQTSRDVSKYFVTSYTGTANAVIRYLDSCYNLNFNNDIDSIDVKVSNFNTTHEILNNDVFKEIITLLGRFGGLRALDLFIHGMPLERCLDKNRSELINFRNKFGKKLTSMAEYFLVKEENRSANEFNIYLNKDYAKDIVRYYNLGNITSVVGRSKELQKLFKACSLNMKLDFSNSDFSGMDLTGIDFTDINLVGSNFSNSKLEGATFTNVDLAGSNFSKAHLEGAKFIDVNLDGANFSNANLTSVTLIGLDLTKVYFVNANMSYGNLSRSNLAHQDLRNVNLTGTNFLYGNLEGVNLSGCNLTYTNFTHADLRKANLSKADFWGEFKAQKFLTDGSLRKKITLESLWGSPFDINDIPGIKGEDLDVLKKNVNADQLSDSYRTVLKEYKFAGMGLGGAVKLLDFGSYIGFSVYITSAYVSSLLSVYDEKLKEFNVEHQEKSKRWEQSQKMGTLYKANLEGANLSEANLQGKCLKYVNLRRANLEGSYLWYANLNGANLEEADISKADFLGASLSETNLKFVKWDYAKFDHAVFCPDYIGQQFKEEIIDKINLLSIGNKNSASVLSLLPPEIIKNEILHNYLNGINYEEEVKERIEDLKRKGAIFKE